MAAATADPATPPQGPMGLAGPGETYLLCGFVLDPLGRQLSRDGLRVPLTSRLFEMLLFLVEHRDRVVERDELLAAVWAGRIVEEGTVARAISSVRAVLRAHGAGDNVITTLPNRGYRLSVPVVLAPAGAPAAAISPAPSPRPRRIRRLATVLAGGGACAALVGLLWISTPWTRRETPFAPPPHSVAVLPFETSGGGADEANLADGLAEELITTLGRVDQLRVTSNRSSFVFRGRTAALGDVARRLGVGAVVEGSVQRFNGRVHITAHLTDTITGFETWSKAYDLDASDPLSVQEAVAGDVVAALKVHLLPDQGPRLVLGGSSNSAASDAFFAGVALLGKGSPADYEHAVEVLSQAITLDPKFERAYELRSRAEWQIAIGPGGSDTDVQNRLFMQSLQDGEKAVALEPDSGTAHAALGFGAFMSGPDMRRAGNEMTMAVRLAPGNAVVRAEAALIYLSLGQLQRAVEDARTSVELDPLSPDALRGAAQIFARAHLADATQAMMQRLQELAANDPDRLHREQCMSALVLGEFAAAVPACQAATPWISVFGLAIAQFKLGHMAEARAAMNDLRSILKDSGAYQYAEVYGAWGDTQASAHWLRVAMDEKDSGLADLLVDDFLIPVRGTQEFDAAARSIGLR